MGEIKLGKDVASSNVFIANNTISDVNKIINSAIEKKSSDIHIKDFYGKCIIEFRINGILYVQNEDLDNPTELISRIKIMANMNVAEKRLPQDGNIQFREFDLRVCSMPSISGECIIIRILNSYLKDISLQSLGFLDENIIKIKNSLSKKHGLILVTGPTGSGKSTTLLSMAKILNNGKCKIITIEDPVENKLNGLVQIQVNDEIGLSFSNVLRSTLRADPDIIIISEIRDELTASIAIRASLTGHLVLATLHTNDCISSFARLVEMKIPKYLILDSLLLIVSQRLLSSEDDKNIKSRVLINEVLELNDSSKEIFSKFDIKQEILYNLKEIGFKTIQDDAKIKGYKGEY